MTPSMAAESPPSFMDFCGVLTQSKRIINAHSRHFLGLSVLFILPMAFAITVYPTLELSFTSPEPDRIESLLRHAKTDSSSSLFDNPQLIPHEFSTKSLIFPIIFSAVVLFLYLCAIGSITYSVYQGFYGRPVKFISAIKSLAHSFLRLFATVAAAELLVSVGLVLFGVYYYLGAKVFELTGINNSSYFLGFLMLGAVVLGIGWMYLGVNWELSTTIVVIESKWGLEPLNRSSKLIKGMKKVSSSLILFFGTFSILLLWISSISSADGENPKIDFDEGWKNWAFIVQIVATSAILTVLLLHYIAANTVLYMYCKASHGELAWEIAKEFTNEYVSLPFDDEKVPHVVSVVYP